MTDEQINQRIAEACGWENCVGGSGFVTRYKGTPSETTVRVTLPNYLHDLNAMHEAENQMELADLKSYCEMLCDWMEADWGRASAPIRAEAFLRTIGKWEEEA